MYVLITLGMSLSLLPLLDRLRGPLTRPLLVFGRTPFFTYVLHIYMVHGAAVLAALATGQDASVLINMLADPSRSVQAKWGFSLLGVYIAWLLVLVAPSLGAHPWVPYAAIIVFCLGTALAIGSLTRGDRVAGDAAIGIFLVASLAFGFFAREIYRHARGGEDPQQFASLLFGGGEFITTDSSLALAAVAVSLAVLATLAALGKEILSYSFDPLMAQASGVRAGFIHYLLMMLIALTIIIGMPVIGAPMVTALLVLPGVTGTLLARQLRTVLAVSVASALIAALVAVIVNATWRFLPLGPLIVLVLFAEFLLAYGVSRLRAAA
jgi:ABC-type Mn2+/Zn2+ transport system permease subunit